MGFSLYPAIDLKGGQVVRLKRGEMDQATIYADDPAAQARRFIEAGFTWVHMVDLDGAFAGEPHLGIDARDGMVATEGWAETSDVSATDLARRFEGSGAAAVIYTDIARDGMLTGVNVAATAALARAVRLPVIASGGVAGVEDISALRAEGAGIEGAILGRALYDGRIEPKAALAAAA